MVPAEGTEKYGCGGRPHAGTIPARCEHDKGGRDQGMTVKPFRPSDDASPRPATPDAPGPLRRALCDQRKKGKEKWLSKGSSEPPARSRSCSVLVPRLYWMPTIARVSFSVMDTEPMPVTLKVFSP